MKMNENKPFYENHVRFKEETRKKIEDLINYEHQHIKTMSRKRVSVNSVVNNGIDVYWEQAIKKGDDEMPI